MVLKTDGDTLWFWTVKTSLTLFWFFCNFLVKVRRGNNGAMGSVPFYNPNMRSSLTFITYFVFSFYYEKCSTRVPTGEAQNIASDWIFLRNREITSHSNSYNFMKVMCSWSFFFWPDPGNTNISETKNWIKCLSRFVFSLGVLAQNSVHWGPAGSPHALLHHSSVLLRRLQTRRAASKPPTGQTAVDPEVHWPYSPLCVFGQWSWKENMQLVFFFFYSFSEPFFLPSSGSERLLWSSHIWAVNKPR